MRRGKENVWEERESGRRDWPEGCGLITNTAGRQGDMIEEGREGAGEETIGLGNTTERKTAGGTEDRKESAKGSTIIMRY